MFGVIHPQPIRDPTWIRGSHVQISIGIGVNVNVILPLQSELFIIDPDVPEFTDNDVDISGPSGDSDDLEDEAVDKTQSEASLNIHLLDRFPTSMLDLLESAIVSQVLDIRV